MRTHSKTAMMWVQTDVATHRHSGHTDRTRGQTESQDVGTHRQDVCPLVYTDAVRSHRQDVGTDSQPDSQDTLTDRTWKALTVRTHREDVGTHSQRASQDLRTHSQKRSGHEDTLTDIKSGRGDILTASQSGLGDTLTNRESRHGDTLTARHWRKTQVCFSFPGPPNFFMSLQKLQSPHSVLMQASQRLHLARGGDTQHCYNTLKCLDTVLKCFFKASPFITKPSL